MAKTTQNDFDTEPQLATPEEMDTPIAWAEPVIQVPSGDDFVIIPFGGFVWRELHTTLKGTI